MKYRKKHSIIFVFCLLQVFSAAAQDYIARKRIHGITDSGFYKILLAPDDKEFAQRDLGNLRITDQEGREIPYIIEHGAKLKQEVAIEDFHFTTLHDTVLKKTTLSVFFDYPVQVSQLRLNIKAPALYKRQARIFYVKNGWTHYYEEHGNVSDMSLETYKDLLLYSEEQNVFALNELYVKFLRIEIMNRDDIPLDIGSIHFVQKPTFLICCLKPRKTYYLSSFAVGKAAPEYDLKYFKDKISANLPIATLEGIEKTEKPQTAKPSVHKAKDEVQNNLFMWACIGFGGLLTLLIARRLMRDMGKE